MSAATRKRRLQVLTCFVAFAAVAALGAPVASAAGAPSIAASSVTDIQGISALLSGKVNPNGLPTTFRFEYGTSTCPGSCTSTPQEGLGSVAVDRSASAAISGLSPDTTYHYRLLATNSLQETATGPEQTFTTTQGFGFLGGAAGFEAAATKLDGTPDTEAGSHPYELTTSVNLNQGGESAAQPGVPFPDGDLKDLRLELPPGLVGNPSTVNQCTLAEFGTPRSSPFEASLSGESCPDASQVGVVAIHSSFGGGSTRSFGLFNLVPPPGVAAELGFAPFGDPVTFDGHVRTAEGEYGLTLEAKNFPQDLSVDGAEVRIWGTPWALSHDSERGNCLNEEDAAAGWAKCTVGPPKKFPRHAFLTLPTSCEVPLAFKAAADSWQRPGTFVSDSWLSRGEGGQPQALGGCERLVPNSIPYGQPTTDRASSATGFEFNLEVPQENLLEPGGLTGTQIRDATVSLPEGVTINPSVGAGLGVCTPAQYAAESASSESGANCPNDSKIGDFRVETPLLEEALIGSIFLARPFENPTNSLIGIYLVAKAPVRGVVIKVAGRLTPNPTTGRLVASFENLPQLPYTHLKAFFREGQRSPLATPASCGTYAVQMQLTPWLASQTPLQRESEFPISSGVGGGPCPAPGAPPFVPGAKDGSVNSNAGSYSPYYLHLTRNDTEQEITSYSAVLPPGLTGKLAGIPLCPDADIEAAKAKTGVEELQAPSCPAGSEIGHTVAGYGLGGVLDYAPGRLYLAGPYHGAPLSIVAVDSALVGPFDLGVIIVRSALDINPQTAQVSINTAGSDPIPHIIDGIPIHLRDIRVYISRPNFTLNPTNCTPFQASSTLTGSSPPFTNPSDITASATDLYQVTDCSALRFAPALNLKLAGGTRRGQYPALQAVLSERPGNANVGRAVVTLPHAEFLAQNHLYAVCTPKQLAAQACPPSSIYGHAEAFTPLLAEPLEGPVYLRSSTSPTNPLPELVAALRGDGGLNFDIEGRIDSGPSGGLRASFEVLPDAPASKFILTLEGGSKGLLQNSTNICSSQSLATAQLAGQNNAPETLKVPIGRSCPKSAKSDKRANRRDRLAHKRNWH